MIFCFVFCRCASVHPEPAQPDKHPAESDADLIRSTDPSDPRRSPHAAAARPGKQQVEKHDQVSVNDIKRFEMHESQHLTCVKVKKNIEWEITYGRT